MADHNQIGQKIGAKGQRTRGKLIDATLQLIETTSLRDVSVVDVARTAGTSAATFYVYFRDVPEVVLAALDNVGGGPSELAAALRRPWSGPQAQAAALQFVEDYCAFWAAHRTIFRVRNLAAEEGDDRFYARRAEAMRPLLDVMTHNVAQAIGSGALPAHLSPVAVAGTAAMMLERLAAIGPQSSNIGGPSFAHLKQAAAYQLAHMFGADH